VAGAISAPLLKHPRLNLLGVEGRSVCEDVFNLEWLKLQ
jgi:hypothetical protein